MSPLLKQQQQFSRDLTTLIQWCNSKNIEVTIGEVLRTEYQQKENVRTGVSKTFNSRHLLKLAADIYFFFDGKIMDKDSDIEPIAAKWQSISADNIAGYYWKDHWDKNHFEKKP